MDRLIFGKKIPNEVRYLALLFTVLSLVLAGALHLSGRAALDLVVVLVPLGLLAVGLAGSYLEDRIGLARARFTAWRSTAPARARAAVTTLARVSARALVAARQAAKELAHTFARAWRVTLAAPRSVRRGRLVARLGATEVYAGRGTYCAAWEAVLEAR